MISHPYRKRSATVSRLWWTIRSLRFIPRRIAHARRLSRDGYGSVWSRWRWIFGVENHETNWPT